MSPTEPSRSPPVRDHGQIAAYAASPGARTAVVVIAALALLATACGKLDGPVAPEHTTRRDVLKRGLGSEPGTLDPRMAEDNAALALATDLYEGLTVTAPDGSTVPGAAESWQVSTDGRVYSFNLRPGLKWSNGEPLAARHFAAGLQALMQPDGTAPNAGLFESVERVEVVDDRTLRLVLHRPLPHLPALLALPAAAPLDPGTADADTVLGNGAFRLVRRVVGERIVLERNPYYRAAVEVRLEGVEYFTTADLGTELNLYRTGELHVTSEVPNTHVEVLRRELPAELHITPYLGVYSYAVNMARLPDRGARLALAMAVDRERITRQVTGAGETPALGWIPDGFAGYRPARFAWRSQSQADSAARARAGWDAARRRGAAPRVLTLCTDASANHHRTAVALADLWRTTLDLEIRIVELEWTVYLDTRRAPGECDLLRLGWSADFIDPEAFAAVFESSHPQNTLGYRSADYDAALERSRTAATSEERMESIAEAEARLLEDVAVIPIFFRVSKRLVKPEVVGAEVNPLGQLASRYLALRRP